MDDMMWYLMGLMNGRGGKPKPLSVTENGTYNVSEAEKAEGYVGFAPVTVDVKTTAVIQPLSVSEPGVYNASEYGCDGFDPVNVSDKYKKLYEQALGIGDSIDTGITDPDGNEVVMDNAIESDWDIVKVTPSRVCELKYKDIENKTFISWSHPHGYVLKIMTISR